MSMTEKNQQRSAPVRIKQSPIAMASHSDKQFQIAMAFIIGFFTLMSISLIHYFTSASLDATELIGAMFGGWIGAIIGFYFGQKPVEQVKETLQEERKRTTELTKYIQERSDKMWERFEQKGGGK